MKKKVAIITLNHGFNYGNKLQNYAVQKIFENMGMNAETIRFFPEGLKVEAGRKKKSVSYYFNRVKARISEKVHSERIKNRKHNFEKFNNNILKMTSKTYTPQTYQEIQEGDYDYFSVGSDQVWNTYFFDFTTMYLLDFVSDDSKKIAFSASFGVDDISSRYYDQTIKYLRKFKSISVREKKGIDILKNSVGVSATLVLDPTLYLTAEQWEDIISSVTCEKPEKYVFLYFLGNLEKNTERYIYRKAKEDGFQIVRMNDLNSKYYTYGPLEFVYLIRNSEYVFTDSFHATCFSVLFHKKFAVVPRVSQGKAMGSRLDSLLNMLGLTDRIHSGEKMTDSDIDYCNVDKRLMEERNETESFLRQAFSMGD